MSDAVVLEMVSDTDWIVPFDFVGTDYTGAFIQLQVRSRPGGDLYASADNDTVGFLTLTVVPASGDIPVTSFVSVNIPAAELTLPTTLPVTAVFDIRVRTAGNAVERPLSGSVEITQAVTV